MPDDKKTKRKESLRSPEETDRYVENICVVKIGFDGRSLKCGGAALERVQRVGDPPSLLSANAGRLVL